MSLDEVNPWNDVDSTLIPLRNILHLGEKTGHVTKKKPEEKEDFQKRVIAGSRSCELLQVLRSISTTKRECNRLHLEIQQRMQDKETSDLMHIDSLEAKIKTVKSLNSHIQSILDNKSQLIDRLQQPFVGDFIKLEARYHRFAAELFPQIAPLLADLNTHLENISWTKALSFQDGQLDGMLSELNSVLAVLQTNFKSLCQMREGMSVLCDHDDNTSHHLDLGT